MPKPQKQRKQKSQKNKENLRKKDATNGRVNKKNQFINAKVNPKNAASLPEPIPRRAVLRQANRNNQIPPYSASHDEISRPPVVHFKHTTEFSGNHMQDPSIGNTSVSTQNILDSFSFITNSTQLYFLLFTFLLAFSAIVMFLMCFLVKIITLSTFEALNTNFVQPTLQLLSFLFLKLPMCFCSYVLRSVFNWFNELYLSFGKQSRKSSGSHQYQRLLEDNQTEPQESDYECVPKLQGNKWSQLENIKNKFAQVAAQEDKANDLISFDTSRMPRKEEEEETLHSTPGKIHQDTEIEQTNHKNWLKRSNSEASSASETSEIRKLQDQHKMKLEEQDRAFQKEQREMKANREKLERDAQEKIRQMRMEIDQKIRLLLNCIHLKHRFEEKEQEWGDALDRLRSPLASIINSYYSLKSEITIDHSAFISETVKEEGKLFANKVANAQNSLANAFETLQSLTEEYDDIVFIRMIMKSLSDQGKNCNTVGQKLVELMSSENIAKQLKSLDDVVSTIDPFAIPTTSMLKKNAPFSRKEDFLNIENAPFAEWNQYFHYV